MDRFRKCYHQEMPLQLEIFLPKYNGTITKAYFRKKKKIRSSSCLFCISLTAIQKHPSWMYRNVLISSHTSCMIDALLTLSFPITSNKQMMACIRSKFHQHIISATYVFILKKNQNIWPQDSDTNLDTLSSICKHSGNITYKNQKSCSKKKIKQSVQYFYKILYYDQ